MERTGSNSPFNRLIKDRKIIVCVGSGGVGKTTVAASIAVRAAAAGRRTLVLTIDPAKRLANALGLAELGNKKSKIEMPDSSRGALFGMMLDQKHAFDELVERIATDPEVRNRILSNHYYQQLSGALAGGQEYMAMEKLYEVATDGDFDLIVLDTPPTKHAMDFLDAPRRMSDFLDGKVVQWFVKPYLRAGKVGFDFVQRGASVMFKMIEKGTGYQALADLSEFFLAFDGLYEGFKARAQAVERMLRRDDTGFVIVTTPQHPAVDDAAFFRDKIRESGMSLAGLVFNRVHKPPLAKIRDWNALQDRAAEALPKYADTVDAMIELAANVSRMSVSEEEIIRDFLAQVKDLDLVGRIPAFTHDIHDLPGLLDLAACL